jgi:hypothetical protein
LKGRDSFNNENYCLISEKKECINLEDVKNLFPREEFMLPLAETLLLPLTGVGEETTLDSLLKGLYFKIFLEEYLKKPQWIPVRDGYVLYDPENEEHSQVLKQVEGFLKTNTRRE